MAPDAAEAPVPSFIEEAWAARGAEVHEISDGIFLGSVKAAVDGKILEKLRISHILVVDMTSSILWPSRFTYKRAKLEDVPTANLLEVLPDALSFLGEAQLRRGPTLVHCTRGISRSASVVIAFLMLFKGLSYEAARKRVEQKRPVVYPNLGFQVQLQHLGVLSRSCSGRHWGEKAAWLKGAMPRGDLTARDSAFNIRGAMSQPVRLQLDRLTTLAEEAASQPELLQQRASWKSLGLFFESLRQYGAVPEDRSLGKTAASAVRLLRSLPEASGEEPLPGFLAARALAGELEAWGVLAAEAWEAIEPRVDEILDSSSEDGGPGLSAEPVEGPGQGPAAPPPAKRLRSGAS